MKNKIFYQDFLFENILINDLDYPEAEYACIQDVAGYKYMHPQKPLYAENVAVRFSMLVEMVKKDAWERFLCSVEKCNSVVLVDDMELENAELLAYKEFYLKTYYANLCLRNKKCYLYKESELQNAV